MHARTRPSPAGLATSIAVLALVVACGGAAAAAGLAKGSVTSRAIKNNAVKSADLKNGTVTTADLKDGTIGSVDVRNDGLSGADIGELARRRAQRDRGGRGPGHHPLRVAPLGRH